MNIKTLMQKHYKNIKSNVRFVSDGDFVYSYRMQTDDIAHSKSILEYIHNEADSIVKKF